MSELLIKDSRLQENRGNGGWEWQEKLDDINNRKESFRYQDVEIFQIPCEIILKIWREEVWPDRPDAINPMSSMMYVTDPENRYKGMAFDMSIYQEYQPTFFGAYHDYQLVGAMAAHRTSLTEMRTRGIWTHKDYRRMWIPLMLHNAVRQLSQREGCKYIWGFGKEGNKDIYPHWGYRKTTSIVRGSHVVSGAGFYIRGENEIVGFAKEPIFDASIKYDPNDWK